MKIELIKHDTHLKGFTIFSIFIGLEESRRLEITILGLSLRIWY